VVLALMNRGRFITLEGIEGSGKTTQAAILADALRTCGQRVMATREPGGSRAGELIRAILLDSCISLDVTAELLLVLADRAQHVAEKIRPALKGGLIVISDRYSDSTIAYQGYGRGLDLKLIRELNRLACGGISPDLTIVLDCTVETGLQRTQARAAGNSRAGDRFEGEQLEFHRRVRDGFRAIAGEEPLRIVLLDSARAPGEVSAAIWDLVLKRLFGHQ
jgi:dTMP kinase